MILVCSSKMEQSKNLSSLVIHTPAFPVCYWWALFGSLTFCEKNQGRVCLLRIESLWIYSKWVLSEYERGDYFMTPIVELRKQFIFGALLIERHLLRNSRNSMPIIDNGAWMKDFERLRIFFSRGLIESCIVMLVMLMLSKN